MKINLLTVADVAKILKISYDKALEIIKYGEITSFKVGRSFRVEEGDLNAYINRQKKKPK